MSLRPPVHEDDHRSGPDDAPVTLVEFGDYECPHCGRAAPIVDEARRQMGDAMRFVFRHFPLSEIHPHAQRAAEAAEAAGSQGRFWAMHDILFENQNALEDQDLIRYATLLGLDTRRFANELDAGVHTERVRQDFLSGVRSGVNGTPTFYVNGLRYDDSWDLPALLENLERAASSSTRSGPRPQMQI